MHLIDSTDLEFIWMILVVLQFYFMAKFMLYNWSKYLVSIVGAVAATVAIINLVAMHKIPVTNTGDMIFLVIVPIGIPMAQSLLAWALQMPSVPETKKSG